MHMGHYGTQHRCKEARKGRVEYEGTILGNIYRGDKPLWYVVLWDGNPKPSIVAAKDVLIRAPGQRWHSRHW